jgi:endo-alpha-1,4-polygalactosaminidase (GH114 family)
VRLICAPKKNNTCNDQVYIDKCHKYYYIAKVSYTKINDNNKANKLFLGTIKLTGRRHLDKLVLLIVDLLGYLFFSYGGLYIARVNSQKIIAQQVVGNNVHELTKGGSLCEV